MAIVNIYEGIFQALKSHIIENSNYSPKVFKSTPESSKVFPVIVMEQIQDNLYDEDLDKQCQRNAVAFELNIFAKDNGTTHRQDIIRELEKLVDEVMNDQFGLTRSTNQTVPNIDDSIYRQYMIYTGVYDTELNKIYRR
jgi:hypothetical protein